MIAVAGSTGDLGGRIVQALRARNAEVRTLVRADFASDASLARACEGARCVVSALSGTRDVIIDVQTRLVDAAVAARVPRFIPSDYALDFEKLPPGLNRNLDWRREFAVRLRSKSIAATSILNGAFMELLTGQAPFLIFPLRRALYWGDADQKMDFTAKGDVASFTAAAALEPSTPPVLRIAGDTLSARELAAIASEVTGKRFRLLRGGSLRRLERIIWLMRTLAPARDDLYPPWQGMQYMHNMFDGRARLAPLDNERHPEVRFTRVREQLQRSAQ